MWVCWIFNAESAAAKMYQGERKFIRLKFSFIVYDLSLFIFKEGG